ncbi:MAG TPA: hypothetical protein VK175_01260 [Leadbetterella sp.]|nr:hypothetical protein [Leadbetterella sp.]
MYYCYISHDKVSNLLAKYEDHVIDELIEKRENKKDKKGEIGISRIFQFLGLTLTYGRSDIYHKEMKLRENIIQKLIRLLELIKNDVEDFNPNEKLKPSHLYYYSGEFKLLEINREQNIVTIKSNSENHAIILHCSLKYFSSNSDFNRPIEINSSNFAFFKGLRNVVFETVFLNIGEDENKQIMGTPIFLLLSDLVGNL